MMTSWGIYWLLKLDAMNMFCGCVAIIGITTTFITCLNAHIIGKAIVFTKITKTILPVLVIFTLLSVFIPTTKQVAIMLIAPSIINNEEVQQLPKELIDLTKNWINELKKK